MILYLKSWFSYSDCCFLTKGTFPSLFIQIMPSSRTMLTVIIPNNFLVWYITYYGTFFGCLAQK